LKVKLGYVAGFMVRTTSNVYVSATVLADENMAERQFISIERVGWDAEGQAF